MSPPPGLPPLLSLLLPSFVEDVRAAPLNPRMADARPRKLSFSPDELPRFPAAAETERDDGGGCPGRTAPVPKLMMALHPT